jgi:serine/threonine protein kinase
MYNPDFINNILIPFNILNQKEAEILAFQCRKLKISTELYLLAIKVLSKQSILDLNLVNNGCTRLSPEKIRQYFDLPLLKEEIRKLIDKKVPTEIPTLPEVGEIIDKYEIREVIGKGATATVYRAFHQFLKIEVALKVLSPQLIISDPLIQDKFIDEAMHTAKLSHHNLIKIYDVEKRGQYTYIVMEYIQGSTVDTILKKQGRIKPLSGIKIVTELCKVLGKLYESGMIHRDIKPGNIMINNKSEIKLADFGLAKIIDEPDKYQTISGKIYGTPYYMSPEQFNTPDKVDLRSDLYSLGATIYHMVTGRVPFETNSIQKIVYMQLFETPAAPDSISDTISPEFSRLIMKLLEKDPDKRYQNYLELNNDLQEIAATYQKIEKKNQELRFRKQKITINMDIDSLEKFGRLIEENPNRPAANPVSV